MGWWNQIWTTRAEDWTSGYLEPLQVFDKLGRTTVHANAAYLSVYLRSMRVVNIRTGLKKFYGTVHSFITIPHISGKSAQFHVLTTPASLSNIDAKNVDRIISMNQRLLGPIPYRGGDLEIEVGLFSIESVNLAQPFLTVLESLSQAAGVSYVNAAVPFVGPLLQGIDLLAGTSGGSILEIGLSRKYQNVETGTMVIMRAAKGLIDLSDLRVDEDYRLIDSYGNAVKDYPYMVLAIDAEKERADWFNIPELAQSYHEIQQALRKGKHQETMEALAVFKRVVYTSPDLLDRHAENLARKVDSEVNNKLKFIPTSKSLTEMRMPELMTMDIFHD